MNKPIHLFSIFNSRRIINLLILLFIFFPQHAQDTKVVSDLHLWTGAAVEKTFKKDWTVSVKQEFRFDQDISRLNNFFTQAGLRFRINKNFGLEARYRYTRDANKEEYYETYTRYSLDLRYRGRISFISVRYRLRYQKEVKGMQLFNLKSDYEKYVRHRITVDYIDLNKLTPFISAEVFQLYTPYQYPSYEFIRVLGGLSYEPGNFGKFKFSYGFGREFTTSLPAMHYVFRINYTYSF